MVEKREYIKTDKNGTEYYRVTAPCSRCGGHGTYYTGTLNGKLVRANPDEGVCYRCNGSGVETYIDKVYTPEHRAELDKQRDKRFAKELADRVRKSNERVMKAYGFDTTDTIYAVLGNTYEIKEQIKSAGGKFNQLYGWYFLEDTDEFDTVAIHMSDILKDNGLNEPFKTYEAVDGVYDVIKEIKKNATPTPESNSQWLHSVGDKVNVKVYFANYFGFDTQFGTMFIYRFVDDNGNVYVWKTSNYEADMVEKTVMLKGTVKENNEYKGEKQTVLTRCKISEVN